MTRPFLAVVVVAVATATVSCESAEARADRQLAERRLQLIEAKLSTDVAQGTPRSKVIELLDAQGVPHEKNPLPTELIAYVGEWQGPFFRRGLHLVFYFDKDGGLVRYEHKEVEGS